MNLHALAAAVVGACAAAILLACLGCLAVGGWTICRAVHGWCTSQIQRGRWQVAIQTPRRPTWARAMWSGGYAVIASPAKPAVATGAGDEPDLTDPRCGTDDQLLQTVRDIWRQPMREENGQ